MSHDPRETRVELSHGLPCRREPGRAAVALVPRAPPPLQYEGLRLCPTVGEPLAVGTGKRLAFVFTARPGPQPPGEATVE